MRQSLPVTLVESSGDQRLVVEAVKICKTYDACPIFPLHPDTQQTFALSTAGKSCLLQEIKPIVLKTTLLTSQFSPTCVETSITYLYDCYLHLVQWNRGTCLSKELLSPCDRATGIGRAQHWVDKEKEIVFVSNREFNKLIFFCFWKRREL